MPSTMGWLADTFEQIRHKPFDIAFNLREDNWKGDQRISLQVKAMQ